MTAAIESNPLDAKKWNLFSLTWPIFLELFLFMLMGTVDTFMISTVSDDAVSGVGATNQIITLAILILEVIGNGAAIVVAQYLGSKKLLESSRVTGNAITLNFGVGVLLSVVLFLFGGQMLQWMNLQGDVLEHAKAYMGIVGGTLFLQAVINAIAAAVRTHGYTKQTMFVTLFMNIIHIGINYLLIFGHWGFPAMGVTGVAISTAVSRLIALFLFFWLLYKVLPVRIELSYYYRLSKEYIRKIMRIGVPSALESLVYHSCQLVFTFYITYLGAEALATRQYALQISSFIYMVSLAIGMGTSIIVGHLVGARMNGTAYGRVLASVKRALIATVMIDLAVIGLRVPILGVFTDNPTIISMGSQVLLMSFFLETGRTCNLVFVNSLRAAGDAKFTVYAGLVSMVCMSLPLGYFLTFTLDLGLVGIWLAIAADEWLRGIIMYLRWKSRAWERYSLVDHQETAGSDETDQPVSAAVNRPATDLPTSR